MPTVNAADGSADLRCQSTRINNIDEAFLIHYIHYWTLMQLHYGLILISRAEKPENVQRNMRELTGFICVVTMILKTKAKTRCKIHNTSHRESRYAL